MLYLKTLSMVQAIWRRMAELENAGSKARVPTICLRLWKHFNHGNRSPVDI